MPGRPKANGSWQGDPAP